jgi:hypothetical protein
MKRKVRMTNRRLVPKQPVLLRSHGIVAFTKSLYTAGKAVPDQMIKDLWKNLKNGLTDAAYAVQRNSAEVC